MTMNASKGRTRRFFRGLCSGWMLWAMMLVMLTSPIAQGQNKSQIPQETMLDYGWGATHLYNQGGGATYPENTTFWQEYEAKLQAAPPAILIVGKESPFAHTRGPIESTGGENVVHPALPAFVGGGDGLNLLAAPSELQDRINAAQHFTARAHAAGVQRVIAYVSFMTLLGGPMQKEDLNGDGTFGPFEYTFPPVVLSRTGFHAFYDQWDTYRSYLGPQGGPSKPVTGPESWFQIGYDGRMYFYYVPEKPQYQDAYRYAPCLNQPGWRTFLEGWTYALASAGYDGMFVDGLGLNRCYCDYCKAKALADYGWDGNPATYDVWMVRKVQQGTSIELINDLRQIGQAINPNFTIGGNCGELHDAVVMTEHAEVVMIEATWNDYPRVFWKPGTFPGQYTAGTHPAAGNYFWENYHPVPDNQTLHMHNTFKTQLAACMRGATGRHWMYPSIGYQADEYFHNIDTATLAMAEAAAFGGGMSQKVNNSFPLDNSTEGHKNDAPNTARENFHVKFLGSTASLYDDAAPLASVAFLVFPSQSAVFLTEAEQAYEKLRWQGYLVDMVNGEKLDEVLNPSVLNRYRHIVIAGNPTIPAWISAAYSSKFIQLPLAEQLTEQEMIQAIQNNASQGTPCDLEDTGLAQAVINAVPTADHLFDPTSSTHVAACAWEKLGKISIHLLNYNAKIGMGNQETAAIEPLVLRVPLPTGVTQINYVRGWSPFPNQSGVIVPANITWRKSNDGKYLLMRVPVRIYRVVEIDYQVPTAMQNLDILQVPRYEIPVASNYDPLQGVNLPPLRNKDLEAAY